PSGCPRPLPCPCRGRRPPPRTPASAPRRPPTRSRTSSFVNPLLVAPRFRPDGHLRKSAWQSVQVASSALAALATPLLSSFLTASISSFAASFCSSSHFSQSFLVLPFIGLSKYGLAISAIAMFR